MKTRIPRFRRRSRPLALARADDAPAVAPPPAPSSVLPEVLRGIAYHLPAPTRIEVAGHHRQLAAADAEAGAPVVQLAPACR